MIKENEQILEDIKALMNNGVVFIACKACADKLGATVKLEELGIKTEYIGDYLTDVIKNPEKHLITV